MVAQAIKSLTDAENEVLLQLHNHHLRSLHVLLTTPPFRTASVVMHHAMSSVWQRWHTHLFPSTLLFSRIKQDVL